MTKLTQRWTGRLSILVAAAVLLTGSIAGLNKWKLAANATSASAKTLNPQQQEPLAEAKVKSAVSKLPLAFEANLGQTDARVKYVARASGYAVYLTEKDAVLSMQSAPGTVSTIRMEFEGSKGASKVTPDEKLPGKVSYMVGERSNWHTDISTYAKIRYQSIYPGIDVAYQGNARQFRYDFVVKPGADPNAIRMNFAGADKVSVTKNGELAVEIGGKTLVNQKPYIYQEVGGEKKEIAGNYKVTDGKVGFELASYDRSETLVIDPTVVVSSLIGGTLNDAVNAVAVNTTAPAAFGVYVTGVTNSPAFAPTVGTTTGSLVGLNDIFVLKTNLTVNTTNWLIYLGGTSNDIANAIAVDQTGRASIAGTTFSANFAALSGSLSGAQDGFYLRLAANGTSVEAGQYIGGATNDFGTGIVLDNNGAAGYNTFVGGYTDSATFLGQTTAGSSDAFIVRIASGGTVTAKVYGGSGAEIANGIAILQPAGALNAGNANLGDVYIVGSTTGGNWTSTDNTVLSVGVGTGANLRDPFILRANGTSLAANYVSFIFGYNGANGGGAFPSPATLDDVLNAIAVDPAGRSIIAGQTKSAGLATGSAFQTTVSADGSFDCLVGRIEPVTTNLGANYLTYYGVTNANENCAAVGTDTSGQIYTAGTTTLIAGGTNTLPMANVNNATTLNNPPVAASPGNGVGGFKQVAVASAAGEVDAFKARFNPNAVGTNPPIPQLNIAEYFYGSAAGTEAFTSLAVTQDRTIYTGGYTSTAGTSTTLVGVYTASPRNQDGVVAAESVNDVIVTPDGFVNPASGLAFDWTDGAATPASQTFVVEFTTSPFVFAASCGSNPSWCLPIDQSTITYTGGLAVNQQWLNVPTADIGPGVVRVSLNTTNAANLPEGTYYATFNVTALGSDNGAAPVRIKLVKHPSFSLQTAGPLNYQYNISSGTYTGGTQTRTNNVTTFDFASTSAIHISAAYSGNSGANQWLQLAVGAPTPVAYRTLGTQNSPTSTGDAIVKNLTYKVCAAGCTGSNPPPNDATDQSNSSSLTPGTYTATVTVVVDRAVPDTRTFQVVLTVVDTSQQIQLTPNIPPTLYNGQTQTIFSTVANPDIFVSGPFAGLALDTVLWSLAPFGGNCTGGASVVTLPNVGTLSNGGPSSQVVFTASINNNSPAAATVYSCRPANNPPNPTVAQININLSQPSSVTIAPAGPVTKYAGQTQQFVASIANAPGVTASFTNTGAGTVGTTSGIYLAPNPINAVGVDTVTATITAPDGTKTSNTVTINLLPASTLTVAPATASLYAGQTQQLTPTTTNPAGNPVTYQLAGGGSISAGGLYTAPGSVPVQATATITATSQFPDGVRTAVTNITLVPTSQVAVACTPGVIYGGQTAACTATTANPEGLAATWTVLSGGGSISAAGVYTAPANAGPNPITVTVQASAVAPDGTRTGTQTITVLPPSAISIVPALTSLYAGNQFLFNTSVANANGAQPTFTVNSGLGTVSSTGLYTAPGSIVTASTAVVRATIATADGPRNADATINLLANPVMTPATVNLYGGQTQQFSVAAPPAGFTLTFSASEGTINAQTGAYTAPSTVATQHTATITATITTNLGAFAASTTSTVTLYPPTTATIAPGSTSLRANQTQVFTCTTTNTVPGTPACTFQVLNPSPLTGTVNASTGLYTAPGVVANALAVTVRATLAGLDGTRTSDATVNLVPVTGVSVTPTTASLYASQTVGLTATSTPTPGFTDVITWTVSGGGTLNTTTGTAVTYSAPATVLTSSSVTVTASAFNATDGTRTATAVITLVPPVSVSIAPASSGPLYPAGTALASSQVLTATVLNSTNPTVTWTLVSGPGSISNATGTQVTYTAPAAPGLAGTAVIMATATTPDPSGPKTATATITVSPQVTISINPTSATVSGTQTRQFTATVGNASNTAVTWTATGGSVSATGLFTAPNPLVTTQYTVTATSAFDTTKSASATVTVVPVVLTGTNAQFVTRQYIDFLGRNPDAAGSAFWVGRLDNNIETRAQVGQDFFNSPEFKLTGQVIVNAYVGLLGRDPDYPGFNFWLSQIRNGQTQTTLINTFVNSPEFQQTYGSLNNDDFIRLLYLNTLQRAATAGDVAFWSPQVSTLGRATIAGYFILSDEFTLRFRTRQLANLLYVGFLARTPDPLGRTFWTNELNQGVSELSVINNFITSVEYLNRLTATTPIP